MPTPGEEHLHCQRGQEFLQLLPSVDLQIGALQKFGNGKKDNLTVHDPAKNEYRKGQYFVSLPEDLTDILPGSVITPVEFIRALGASEIQTAMSGLLLTNHEEDWIGMPLLSHNEHYSDKDGDFKLTVFHGSVNDSAIRMSELATIKDGHKNPMIRAEYQMELLKLMRPIINKDSTKDVVFRISEDCIASGDTIIGTLSLLTQASSLNLHGKIRIDVAIATAQGILMIREFARQNGLDIELNVGYMAFGLSAGEKCEGRAKKHANYITYPPEILEMIPESVRKRLEKCRQGDCIYVVGDMGDMAKSLPYGYDRDCPWNYYRAGDRHGEKPHTFIYQSGIDPSKPTNLYFANGGHLMRAYDYLLNPKIVRDSNQLTVSAKRIWSDDKNYGYGVLIYDAPEELFHQFYNI